MGLIIGLMVRPVLVAGDKKDPSLNLQFEDRSVKKGISAC
jgi:hypothetical protein